MVSDLQLHFYANSNEPLPEKLHGTLHSFLNQLDVQWKTHERDRLQVVEAIESRRSLIEALELEIEGLSRVEIRITEGQKSLRTKQRRYATTVTAYRQLPPEVVARIIQFAIQGPNGALSQKDRLFFAQLRSVCRLWRETSFSTPSLWRAVGLDLGQMYTLNPQMDIKAYISKNFTSWFSRAGKDAPMSILVCGPLSRTTSDIMDFRYEPLPYSGTRNLHRPISSPPPVKRLTIEFEPHSQSQPPSREVILLTHNFPNLSILSVIESIPPAFPFPLQFVHESLARLHLKKIVLASNEMEFVLAGVPRLQILGLEQCSGKRRANSHSSPWAHTRIQALTVTCTLPEACFEDLAFPSLKHVYVGGNPSSLRDHANKGRAFGQFLQRCGGPVDFYLTKGWPNQVLDNILNSNTAIEVVGVPGFSSFRASPRSGRRLIPIPPSLKGIEILWANQGTKSQLLEFCDSLTLADQQILTVDAPRCLPSGVAFFPWPRPENWPPYILCRGRLREHSGLEDQEL
ncbi:hypothetical protein BKA70DRAFT_1352825 [Coprinopsis sp. MPI-PUGE-AT-0042]|nr:hypothetical protein BKA70DRAFT_1352825 [Coprinopsis sp. MPI-PUGE-AT-0042]